MHLIIAVIGWTFVILAALCVLWAFVRYVLPIAIMLAVIAGGCYVGYQAFTGAGAKPAAAVAQHVAPKGSVKYCQAHPNARICEDRD